MAIFRQLNGLSISRNVGFCEQLMRLALCLPPELCTCFPSTEHLAMRRSSPRVSLPHINGRETQYFNYETQWKRGKGVGLTLVLGSRNYSLLMTEERNYYHAEL